MSEYLKIYIEGQRPVMMLLSMKKLEERLPAYFMRIHRSYIVNMKRVVEVSRSRVVIDADTVLPVGDIYKDALMQYLSDRSLGR
jgi:two-component system, LytTR family, response regulator